ncbi:MAG: OmpA family protein [Colwellia sp.]|nr:OmpA family protein [Colwellia sp.]
MIIQPKLLSLVVVMALSACSSSKVANSNSSLFTQVETSKHFEDSQMQLYISSAESQLLLLEQQSTKHCITGQLSIAQSSLALAKKEYTANMNKDAFITLVEFDRQVRKIRCINQYINGNLGCGQTNKKTVLKRWYSEGDFDQCKKVSTAKADQITNDLFITETLYDFNQDKIKPIYYKSLNSLVALMKRYPESKLLIRGHTDSKGSTTYNMQLSKKRANSVAKYFTDRGIATSKIVRESKDKENIRELEQSDVSRVFNRYTSITLILDKRDHKTI